MSGSITSTYDVSVSDTSDLNTGTTNFDPLTESTNFYFYTETAHVYMNIETATSYMSYANTATKNYNSSIDILFHSLHVSTASQIKTDYSEYSIVSLTISASYGGDSYIASLITLFSVSNLTVDTPDRSYDKTNVHYGNSYSFLTETMQTSEITTTVNLKANSDKSESLLSSLSLNNSRIQQMITGTQSPWISTLSVNDQISYTSYSVTPSFSSFQHFADTIETLPNNSVNNELPSSITKTVMHFLSTTHMLFMSHLDDTDISLGYSTTDYQTFSQKHGMAVSASTWVFKSIDHHLPPQSTEYQTTEFISSVTGSNTYSSNKEVFPTGTNTTVIHTTEKLSDTQFGSENDDQTSTTDFQSTYPEHYFQSTDEFFSSEKPDNFVSTIKSTSLLLPMNSIINSSGNASEIKTTNMQSIETQSSMVTTDPSLLTNTSSIQISSLFSGFKTTLLTTRIHSNDLGIPSMITPSFHQANSDNLYLNIDTSFEDSLFSLSFFYESFTSRDHVVTTFSSVDCKSNSVLPTNTVQNKLSEKTKTIIFIGTTSGVVTIIVILLVTVLARRFMSKDSLKSHTGDETLSWSNTSCSLTTAFPDNLFAKKNNYPMLNTASYEYNWNHEV